MIEIVLFLYPKKRKKEIVLFWLCNFLIEKQLIYIEKSNV